MGEQLPDITLKFTHDPQQENNKPKNLEFIVFPYRSRGLKKFYQQVRRV
jgi:hypothetical protein